MYVSLPKLGDTPSWFSPASARTPNGYQTAAGLWILRAPGNHYLQISSAKAMAVAAKTGSNARLRANGRN